VERRKQEEHFIPNAKVREKRYVPSFLCIFFFYGFFFLCVFFSFLLLEKKMPRKKRLKQKGKNRRPQARAKSERAE
jgi:hypothetical protein